MTILTNNSSLEEIKDDSTRIFKDDKLSREEALFGIDELFSLVSKTTEGLEAKINILQRSLSDWKKKEISEIFKNDNVAKLKIEEISKDYYLDTALKYMFALLFTEYNKICEFDIRIERINNNTFYIITFDTFLRWKVKQDFSRWPLIETSVITINYELITNCAKFKFVGSVIKYTVEFVKSQFKINS